MGRHKSGDKDFNLKKEREELRKIQQSYGNESESSSDSEIEDETGDLNTEVMDQGIAEVLKALRDDPTGASLKDAKNVKFYPEIGAEGVTERKVEKPVRLKDYHRQNLLDDGKAEVETYNEQQTREKEELLSEIKNQFADSDVDNDSDDGLLSKRKETRDVEPLALPDPDEKPDEFLDAFISGKGWIPRGVDAETGEKHIPTYDEVVEDSDSFDDLTDKFESAYNFRFEDPNAAEIVSYARDQSTMRRKQDGSRQRQRELKRAQREKEEQQRKLEVAKLRKHKVSEVSSKLERLQQVLGDDEIASKFTKEDLEGEWNDDEWDKRMQRLFNDEFYDKEDNWKPDGDDVDDDEDDDDMDADMDADADADASKAANAREFVDSKPLDRKLSKKELKRKAEEFVDANNDLLLEETMPAASFRYREVEPESYGLSARDILLASDKDLNEYVGLKKLAAFRDKSKLEKDRKRYSKKRRLRDWRAATFGSDEGPTEKLWEELKAEQLQQAQTQPAKHKHKHKQSQPKKKRKHN